MAGVLAAAAARMAAHRSSYRRGILRGLIRDLFDPYRPELHYMRGPGPKWREKHLPQAQAEAFPGARYRPV